MEFTYSDLFDLDYALYCFANFGSQAIQWESVGTANSTKATVGFFRNPQSITVILVCNGKQTLRRVPGKVTLAKSLKVFQELLGMPDAAK